MWPLSLHSSITYFSLGAGSFPFSSPCSRSVALALRFLFLPRPAIVVAAFCCLCPVLRSAERGIISSIIVTSSSGPRRIKAFSDHLRDGSAALRPIPDAASLHPPSALVPNGSGGGGSSCSISRRRAGNSNRDETRGPAIGRNSHTPSATATATEKESPEHTMMYGRFLYREDEGSLKWA